MDYLSLRKIKQVNLIPKPITGKGILNTMINKSPFELHVPGYNYLGPGTNLDLRLEKGVKPANKLDELALQHDIAYSKSNKMSDRHKADYALQEGAWNRVLSKDAGLGEKAAAWLTTNAMKVKRSVGAGLLTQHPVYLNDEQKAALSLAVQNEKPITLTISTGRTKESIMGETYLPLTSTQIKNLKSGKRSRKIKLSKKQLKKIKSGGFLPALLAAAPVVAGVVSTLANAYSNKKTNDKLIEEKIRHDKALENIQKRGKGVYINKNPNSGNGVYINKKPNSGKGVYINKKPNSGNGVYINKKPNSGNGLLEQLLKKKKTLR